MKLPLNQEVSSKICYNHEKDTVTRPIGVVPVSYTHLVAAPAAAPSTEGASSFCS